MVAPVLILLFLFGTLNVHALYPPTCGSTDSFVLPDPDCSKYWVCEQGEVEQITCPSGEKFNPKADKCDDPDNLTCAPVCPEEDDGTTVYFSDEDCTKFWYCFAGYAKLQTCPNDLYWNSKLDVCDFPWDVDCVNQLKI